MTTEAEAKTKWCPFARTGVLAGSGAVSVNRHVTDDMPNPQDRVIEDCTRCIGSACMMWRWNFAPENLAFRKVESIRRYDVSNSPKDHPPHPAILATLPAGEGWKLIKTEWDYDDNSGWYARWERPFDANRTGYCGLAK